MSFSVDLNCDMGEGMANDALIMPFISSANIACGYHAGDTDIMQQTIELAMMHHVAIGAHPSFPDKENFGRANMRFSAGEVCDMVKEQVELLANRAAKNNCTLHHVKPHGALYNMASNDEELAGAICKAMLEADAKLLLYAQSGSKLSRVAASMDIRVCHEVFADRTYQADGSLTPRSQPNALISNEAAVTAQVLQMITEQTVTTTGGKTIPVRPDTVCIHGDGDHAVQFAKAIYGMMGLNNICIKST